VSEFRAADSVSASGRAGDLDLRRLSCRKTPAAERKELDKGRVDARADEIHAAWTLYQTRCEIAEAISALRGDTEPDD
jgi:hypothetical protein